MRSFFDILHINLNEYVESYPILPKVAIFIYQINGNFVSMVGLQKTNQISVLHTTIQIFIRLCTDCATSETRAPEGAPTFRLLQSTRLDNFLLSICCLFCCCWFRCHQRNEIQREKENSGVKRAVGWSVSVILSLSWKACLFCGQISDRLLSTTCVTDLPLCACERL